MQDNKPFVMAARSLAAVDRFIKRKKEQGVFRVVEKPSVMKTKSGDVHVLKYETGER